MRFIGDEVAAVAAVDEKTAKKALELIRVEYEPLTAVLDPEQALEPGSPLVHDEKPGNIAGSIPMGFGDVDAGFAEADYIMTHTYRTQSQRHACMETHCCVGVCRMLLQ